LLSRSLCLLIGLFLALGVALDAFQTIILPRRPTGRFRITRIFYRATWSPWVRIGQVIKTRHVRDQLYSIYGPLSLLTLFALWASLLVVAFACLFFALGSPFTDSFDQHSHLVSRFYSDLYVSGTTLVTLGLGDVTPHSRLARALMVLEAGTGLGFTALVIGYVPVIYQAFSRREVSVAMLDGRAGSPPTASQLLDRHGYKGGEQDLIALLGEWERWSAELLETHISYPILCYYRSQHDNQSWLAALLAVLDACALLITNMDGPQVRQAQLTFAIGRHALIDLGHVFGLERNAAAHSGTMLERLPPEVFRQLCGTLGQTHLNLCGDPSARERLTAIRALYEPHAHALAEYLKLDLPLWIPEPKKGDPWKTVADLRMVAETERALGNQVSAGATSAHLYDSEHGL
jgi:hypothetical protein